MKALKIFLPVVWLTLLILLFCSCEKFVASDEINGLIKTNDLSMCIKIEGADYAIAKEYETDQPDTYVVKLDSVDELTLRGKAPIESGKRYRLSFIMKNISADPVISYSFWKGSVTSTRHYTLCGENGNPPTSATQEIYEEWTTFSEIVDTKQGEDSLMISMHCTKGTFYIKEICIEEL